MLRMRLNAPERVIDLSRIESLRGIRDAGDHLAIVAMRIAHQWPTVAVLALLGLRAVVRRLRR